VRASKPLHSSAARRILPPYLAYQGKAFDLRVGEMFGNYKITGLLGKGGMGDVYQAFDTGKKRTVALKVLSDQYARDETFRTRFLRESHAAAVLQEPHVIPIHDWGDIDGNLYIDMRLVQGQTLADILEHGPLEPARAVSITNQIASALDAAHAERLIHRDVKPQNIIITAKDFAYLVDFGIAAAAGDTKLTHVGSHIGSIDYMAPERFEDREATAAVDVYALACVLYQSLTGHTPFPSGNTERTIVSHLTAPVPQPSAVDARVPASFDEVIARGMAKEPDDRYGSPGALGRAAERALRAARPGMTTARTTSAPAAPMPPPTQRVVQPPPQMAPPTQTPELPATQVGPPVGYAHATYPGPPPGPPTGPVQAQTPDSGGRSQNWVLPTVITISVVLVLALVGVVIGLLVGQNSGTSASSSPTLTPRQTEGSQSSQPTSSSAPSPTATVIPPIVKGADYSGQTCDQGFSVSGTGFGTHSGRGSAETSCYFASSVLNSYWAQHGQPTRGPQTVSAPGSVSCGSVAGARCDGNNFLMQCAATGSDDWVTCTGGNNARVYIY
jgi:serine/threonine kinase PknH